VYIALRTVIAAFYDVNVIGVVRVTDVAGIGFPIVLLIYTARSGGSREIPARGIIHAIVAWMIIALIFHNIIYDTYLPIYKQAKQFARFLNAYAVFLAFPLIFRNMKDAEKLMKAFMLSTVFPLVQIVMIQGGVLSGSAYVDSGMITGVYGNYGVFVLVGVSGALVTMYWLTIQEFSGAKRVIVWLMLVTYIAVILLTLSRTAFVLASIIIVALIFSQLKVARFKNLILGIIVLALFATSAFVQDRFERIEQRSQNEFKVLAGEKDVGQGLHGRIGRWEWALEIYYYEYDLIQKAVGADVYIGPHGDYVFWLTSYGAVGLILYLAFVFSCTKVAFVYRSRAKDSKIKSYALLVLTAWVVWIVTAISTNSSFMPDYSYFIVGNTAVLFGMHAYMGESADKTQSLEKIGKL